MCTISARLVRREGEELKHPSEANEKVHSLPLYGFRFHVSHHLPPHVLLRGTVRDAMTPFASLTVKQALLV